MLHSIVTGTAGWKALQRDAGDRAAAAADVLAAGVIMQITRVSM
jgi:hypothetical protein